MLHLLKHDRKALGTLLLVSKHPSCFPCPGQLAFPLPSALAKLGFFYNPGLLPSDTQQGPESPRRLFSGPYLRQIRSIRTLHRCPEK